MSAHKARSIIALSVLLAGAGISIDSFADTATSTMAVSASVVAACTVSAGTLAFGQYSGTALAGNASLTVNCTNAAPYTIALGAGAGTGATTTTRVLTGSLADTTLNYELYQDAALSTPWGDTVGTDTYAGTGSGLDQSISIYGQITADQNGSVGDYTDSVAVTVNY